jgi:hypothetical protein
MIILIVTGAGLQQAAIGIIAQLHRARSRRRPEPTVLTIIAIGIKPVAEQIAIGIIARRRIPHLGILSPLAVYARFVLTWAVHTNGASLFTKAEGELNVFSKLAP